MKTVFSRIFKAIRATTNQNDPTLSVIHSVKSKAKYGGWITEKLYDRSVFFLSKVAHGMRTLAKLRYYKFGNSFLYQCSGIPIGGPVSGAILESVLCMEEHRFDRFRWPQVAARTKLRGKRETWITFLRYVDDVLAISFWFCPSCIEKLINVIYHDTVGFDKSNDGESTIDNMNGLKFLDLWVFVGWERSNIFLVNKKRPVRSIGNRWSYGQKSFPDTARRKVGYYKKGNL